MWDGLLSSTPAGDLPGHPSPLTMFPFSFAHAPRRDVPAVAADPARHDQATGVALKDLVHIAVHELGQVEKFTGRKEPTVIT